MQNIPVIDGKWKLVQNINASGTVTTDLATENTFIDKNIEFQTITPAGALGAGSGYADAISDTNILGTSSPTIPASGHYVKVAGEANVSVSTSGFLDAGDDVDVSFADTYYPLVEATFMEDGPDIRSVSEGYVESDAVVGTISSGDLRVLGGTLTAGDGYALLQSDGLSDGTSVDPTKKIALSAVDSAGYYELEASGSGTVYRDAISKQQTTAGYMVADAVPVVKIPSDSLSSATGTEKYYVKQSTMSATVVTPSTIDQTVTISDGYFHEGRTVTVNALVPVTPTTSLSNTGVSTYFNTATSSEYDISIIPQYSNDAGFVNAHTNTNNGGVEYYSIKRQTITETYTSVSGETATRGTRTESVGWKNSAETLDVATFSNTATPDVSYVDISDTTAAPVLVANDYLYIDKGWTDAVKISLAKLVPDGSDIAGHSEYILLGHSAYDNDGNLVAGSIPTYAGAYSVA